MHMPNMTQSPPLPLSAWRNWVWLLLILNASQNNVQATALQCWTSLQKNYRDQCLYIDEHDEQSTYASACETDITGVVSMYALQLASNSH